MPLTAANFDYLRGLVHQRSAIVLESEKIYLAEARLLSLAWREGFSTVGQFVDHLRLQPTGTLHSQVVEAMTNNETSFFRDLQPFENLRKNIIPQLIQRRGQQRTLNIWSAACSSGQEVHSIAMLLLEHFPALSGWNLRLIASDLCGAMIERVRAGRYGQLEVNRGLPATLLVKYFHKMGLEWQIHDNIRSLVETSQINLAADTWPPLPSMDIIFLRNVLIYFDPLTKKRILGKIRRVLRPDGYLFLGGAETTLNVDDAFERVAYERSSCYRLHDATKLRATLLKNNCATVGSTVAS